MQAANASNSNSASEETSIDCSGVNTDITSSSKDDVTVHHSSPTEYRPEEATPSNSKMSINRIVLSKEQLFKQYKHRPPPPKPPRHVKDYQPLLSKSHTDAYECLQAANASNSNSASEETAWKTENNKQPPPIPDETSEKPYHDNQRHYQQLHFEGKKVAANLKYESLRFTQHNQ